MASDRLQRRVQQEMEQAPEGTLERFKAAHGGTTPLQWAIAQHPSVRADCEKHAPHLLPPKK